MMDVEAPEMRWPYKSKRGKVYPQAPPSFVEPKLKVSDTVAAQLRVQNTAERRQRGDFDLRQDAEARKDEQDRRYREMSERYYRSMQVGYIISTAQCGLVVLATTLAQRTLHHTLDGCFGLLVLLEAVHAGAHL